MGYYTDFTYVDDASEVTLEEFAKAETNHFGDPSYGYNLGDGSTHGKWYDFDDDMCAISKAFPGKLIVVDGRGEEQGDEWRAFFRDGELVEKLYRPDWKLPTRPSCDQKDEVKA